MKGFMVTNFFHTVTLKIAFYHVLLRLFYGYKIFLVCKNGRKTWRLIPIQVRGNTIFIVHGLAKFQISVKSLCKLIFI